MALPLPEQDQGATVRRCVTDVPCAHTRHERREGTTTCVLGLCRLEWQLNKEDYPREYICKACARQLLPPFCLCLLPLTVNYLSCPCTMSTPASQNGYDPNVPADAEKELDEPLGVAASMHALPSLATVAAGTATAASPQAPRPVRRKPIAQSTEASVSPAHPGPSVGDKRSIVQVEDRAEVVGPFRRTNPAIAAPAVANSTLIPTQTPLPAATFTAPVASNGIPVAAVAAAPADNPSAHLPVPPLTNVSTGNEQMNIDSAPLTLLPQYTQNACPASPL